MPIPNLPDVTPLRVKRLVTMKKDGDVITVSINLASPLPLGLQIHKGERDASLRRIIKQAHGTIFRSGRTCQFHAANHALAQALRAKLQHQLNLLARKPLSPRQIERLLGITSTERNRWAKDGRLPRSGDAVIRKGPNMIRLATYPPDIVEALLDRPEIIALWRANDKTHA